MKQIKIIFFRRWEPDFKYLRKIDYQNNNLASCFQRKCYSYFNKIFHFWKCFEVIFYFLKKSILLFFFSVFNIDLRYSPLLLWIDSFCLIPIRTSIVHSSEIIDLPKKLMDENKVKTFLYIFLKASVMKTNIFISVPSNPYISLKIKP